MERKKVSAVVGGILLLVYATIVLYFLRPALTLGHMGGNDITDMLFAAAIAVAGVLLIAKRPKKILGIIFFICALIRLIASFVDFHSIISTTLIGYNIIQVLAGAVLLAFLVILSISLLAKDTQKIQKLVGLIVIGPIIYMTLYFISLFGSGIFKFMFASNAVPYIVSQLSPILLAFGLLISGLYIAENKTESAKSVLKPIRFIVILITIANLVLFIITDFLLKGHTVGSGTSSISGLYTREVMEIESNLWIRGAFCLVILMCLITARCFKKHAAAENGGEMKLYERTNKTIVVCFVLSLIGLAITAISYGMYN